ncbi:NAD(P)-binding domain-containing protein [Streptomyces sp. NPDC046374]|uniref:NAD(P)-binding domain-containing protein n=1 Tax=Streptomyces sp. NPDC046374 TaxID=3154917 RepID=UPI0033E0B95D
MTPATGRPATRIVVAGYGTITAAIIPHLLSLPGAAVGIVSRHLAASPQERAELLRPAELGPFAPDVLIGCFASDDDARSFWEHDQIEAAISTRRPVCIDLSTISPGRAEAWAARTTALGALPVECPVTGSRPGAIAGTLSAFLHEPHPDPRTDLVLGAFVRNRYRFTAPGQPARFKLIYNAWGATILHSLGVFARELPKHLGPDDYPTAVDAITHDGWMSVIASAKLDRIERGDYGDPDFTVGLMLKDLLLARDLIGPGPLVDAAISAFTRACTDHGQRADFTAVADMRDAA